MLLENNVSNILQTKDIIEIISIIITFLLGVLSMCFSAKTNKKLKESEFYKHSLKMKELKIDTRYKNNQLAIEEIYELLINIKNLSIKSEYYLFKNRKQKIEQYNEVVIKARESLIWVQKRVNILSVYMNKHIYSNIGELFKMVYNLLNNLEAKNYKKFFDNHWENDIYEIEEKAFDIIQKIQADNEEIIEK